MSLGEIEFQRRPLEEKHISYQARALGDLSQSKVVHDSRPSENFEKASRDDSEREPWELVVR
jgi:hypothetical protein